MYPHIHSEPASNTKIQKTGFWTSMTFLTYIHYHIVEVSKDISMGMAQEVPLFNIALVESTDSDND